MSGTILLLKSFSAQKQEAPYFAERFKNVFALITAERNYYFNVTDPTKQQIWIESINEAIQTTEMVEDNVTEHVSIIQPRIWCDFHHIWKLAFPI